MLSQDQALPMLSWKSRFSSQPVCSHTASHRESAAHLSCEVATA